MASVTTRVQRIMALQAPFDLGLDSNENIRYGFNVLAMRDDGAYFAYLLIALMDANNTARDIVFSNHRHTVSYLVGSKAALPTDMIGKAVLHITETGGTSPESIHNQAAPAYGRPTAQIVARAKSLDVASVLASRAYDALVKVTNLTITFTVPD